MQGCFKVRWNLSKKTLLTIPTRFDYSTTLMNITNKTQSEIKQHLKRTRKTRVRELCAKHNTTSYSEAQLLDTIDLCVRINAHLATLKK
jgi:hypothetical protein